MAAAESRSKPAASRASKKKKSAAPRRALPAELTIYTMAELHPQWLGWLAAGDAEGEDTLQVDGAAVDQVDAAGVQLLLSLSNALAARQRRLHLSDPSGPLRQAVEALGVGALLADRAPGALA